jgi:predicted DNA repair protein MutK
MLGGAYLCFEGFEKVFHKLFHDKRTDEKKHEDMVKAISDPGIDMVEFEKKKIKGAIRTDFILSAEIIVIALGTVKAVPMMTQVLVVSAIALFMTIGVYGLVAGIVKLDDAGIHLLANKAEDAWGNFKRWSGKLILRFAPYMMKTLSIVGTAAMFLVGGSILAHGIPPVYDFIHHAGEAAKAWPPGGVMGILIPVILNGITGVIAGGIVMLGVSLIRPIVGMFRKTPA